MTYTYDTGISNVAYRELQAKHGTQSTHKLLDVLVGNNESTFLGLKEISTVAELMGAQTSLQFDQTEAHS